MSEVMDQPDQSLDAAADSTSTPATVGELLIAARERCHLGAADVARQLRLGLRQVEALEANQFDRIPGNTFVRGFIRNYAKVVQADAAELLEAYEQTRPKVTPQVIVTQDERIEYTKRPIPKWVWIVLGLLLLALALPVLIYFALRDEGGAPTPPPLAAVPVLPAAPVAPPLADTTVLSLPPPQAIPLTEAPTTVSTPPDATATGAASTPSTPPPVVSPKPGESSMKLSFLDEKAWVEVRDKTGKVVFSQLNQAGTEQTIVGTPPFSVVVGNAAKVRITYNGKPVDLAPHTKVNVARFTLE